MQPLFNVKISTVEFASAAAEAEKPVEAGRPAASSSAETARSPSPAAPKPARSPSPAPFKPDYNFARAGLPDQNGAADYGAPSSAPQDRPEPADPYSFALAPLPDAEPNNSFPTTSGVPTASQGYAIGPPAVCKYGSCIKSWPYTRVHEQLHPRWSSAAHLIRRTSSR